MRIASDGLPFILPPALATAAAAGMGQPLAAAALGLASAGIAAFFRDPERASGAASDAALSPADGKVISVSVGDDGRAFVAIFLSLLNVHVARSPLAGELRSCRRVAGGYAAAYSEAASRNARVEMLLDTEHGPLEVALMAGLVARRVLPWVDVPQRLSRGQRVAIIRFGSRAEIRLPGHFEPCVTAGDRVRAGESVIARRASATN